MQIDMSDYIVVHGDKRYSCLSIIVYEGDLMGQEIQVVYINDSGKIGVFRDKSSKIYFVRK